MGSFRSFVLFLCLQLHAHIAFGGGGSPSTRKGSPSSSFDQILAVQNDIDMLLKKKNGKNVILSSASDDDGKVASSRTTSLFGSSSTTIVNPFRKKKKKKLPQKEEENARIERLTAQEEGGDSFKGFDFHQLHGMKKSRRSNGSDDETLTQKVFHILNNKKEEQVDDEEEDTTTADKKMEKATTTTLLAEGEEENDDDDDVDPLLLSPSRELQTDTCEPFSLARQIVFDPVGVTIASGSTVDAPANLAVIPGCTDQFGVDSPTDWYTFTTTTTAPFFLTTCSPNTNFNTVISLFSQSDSAGCTVVCLGQNDDHGFGTELDFCAGDATHSVALVEPLQPDTYYVAISGANSFDSGSYELVLVGLEETEPSPTPPSPAPPSPTPPTGGSSCPLDDAIAIEFDSTGSVTFGSTVGQPATLPTIDGCSSDVGSPTSWYRFTTPTTGTVLLTTCSPNTSFDTVMTVFREVNLAECTAACLGSNDDHGTSIEICSADPFHSAILLNATAASTYYVTVSGYSSGIAGSFQLLIAPVAAPPTPTPPGPSQLPTPFPTPSSSFVPGPTPFPTPSSSFVPGPTPTTPPLPTPFPTSSSSSLPGGLCPQENAIPITYNPNGVTVSGDSTGATNTFEGIDGCGTFRSSPAVWYTFTTPESSSLGITTCSPNTSFDTYIAVYRAGQNECELICEGFDDDHGQGSSLEICATSGLHSLVFLESTPVDTYYVQVSGFGSGSFGPFELSIFPNTDETLPPAPTPTFPPPTFPSPGTIFPTPTLQPAPTPTFPPPTFPSPGTIFPTPSGSSASCPPLESAAPIAYDSAGASVVGTTTGAPSTFFVPPGDGCSEPTDDSPTVWYTFTTPTAEDLVVTTCSPTTSFDTMLAVYRADPQGNCGLECFGFSDDHTSAGVDLAVCSTSTLHSAVGFRSVPGDTYYVAVTGFSAFETGVFELQIFPLSEQPTSPPIEFECPLNNAIELTYDLDGIFISGTTIGLPADMPDIAGCSENTGSPTVWYKVTTDADLLIAATTCTPNTSFNTIIGVFREVDLDECSVACEAFNDDHTEYGVEIEFCSPTEGHSLALFESQPPTDTYYIAVSGSGPSEFGTFELLILPIPDDTSAPGPVPTLPPVPRPTPFPAPAPSPAPAPAPTPNPTKSPSADVEMTIEEAEITVDVQPVPGPFVERESTPVVEDGSESFFRSMFGNDPDQLVNVELLEHELLEPDGNNRRRRRTQDGSTLRLSLKVLATYEDVTEEEFQAVLEGFVSENPDMYIESLQTAEAEAGTEQEYFSSLETAAIVEADEKVPPPPAPTPTTAPTAPAPADEGGANAAVIGGSVAAGVFALILLVVGVIFCNRKKSEDENKKDDAVEEEEEQQPSNIQYDDSNIQYDNDQPTTVNTVAVANYPPEYNDDISMASSIVFVAQGVKTTADTKVGISLARRQQDGSEDIIILSGITESSIFAGQGLREGMVVKKINNTPIHTVEEASAIIRDYVGTMTIEAELVQVPQVETFDA